LGAWTGARASWSKADATDKGRGEEEEPLLSEDGGYCLKLKGGGEVGGRGRD